MHQYHLAKGLDNQSLEELHREKLAQESKLSIGHPEELFPNREKKDKYSIRYCSSPKFGVIGNVNKNTWNANSPDNFNFTDNTDNFSKNSKEMSSIASSISKSRFPTSPTNRPGYLNRPQTSADNHQLTAEVESRVLKKLSESFSPNNSNADLTFEYPLKLPESRYQLIELHAILDKMLDETRYLQQVLAASNISKDNSKRLVLFNNTNSLDSPSMAALDGKLTNRSVVSASSSYKTSTNFDATVGQLSDKVTNNIVNTGSAKIRPLDTSVSGLEKKAQKISYDVILAELTSQALSKATKIHNFYRKHIVAVEQEYHVQMKAMRAEMDKAVTKAKSYEAKAKAAEQRGKALLRNAMDRQGDTLLPEIRTFLSTQENVLSSTDIPTRLLSFDNNQQMQLEDELLEGGTGNRSRTKSQAYNGGVDPAVAELLAQQLSAERSSNARHVEEMTEEIATLNKKYLVAVTHNRKVWLR